MDFIEAIKKQDYFEQFITRNTYHSNGIEGNTLSYADTYAIIFNDNSFKVTAEPREIYEAIKTKRYTMARIRRIILSAFLNITAEIQNTPVAYLRILGVKSGKGKASAVIGNFSAKSRNTVSKPK